MVCFVVLLCFLCWYVNWTVNTLRLFTKKKFLAEVHWIDLNWILYTHLRRNGIRESRGNLGDVIIITAISQAFSVSNKLRYGSRLTPQFLHKTDCDNFTQAAHKGSSNTSYTVAGSVKFPHDSQNWLKRCTIWFHSLFSFLFCCFTEFNESGGKKH